MASPVLGADKLCNPHQILCSTLPLFALLGNVHAGAILYSNYLFFCRFSILAIQEVESSTALTKVCDELNKPKLRRVMDWHEKFNFRKNRYVYKNIYYNNLGFIYLENHLNYQIDFLSYQPLTNNNEQTELFNLNDIINTLIVRMRIDEQLFLTLVNFQLVKNKIITNISQQQIYSTLTNLLKSDNVIILGDFTGLTTKNYGKELLQIIIVRRSI